MFWISLRLDRHLRLDGGVPAAVHQHRPIRPRICPRRARRRRPMRGSAGRTGLRRLCPDDLRGPSLDHGRHLGHPVRRWCSARSSASSPATAAGWVDSVLGRIAEIFLGIPLLLGGILFLYTFPNDPLTTPFLVQVSQGGLRAGRPRLAVDHAVDAIERAAGQAERLRPGGPRAGRVAHHGSSTRHILPNSLASVIVVSTINLGAFISVEATSVLPRHRPAATDHLLGHPDLRGVRHRH